MLDDMRPAVGLGFGRLCAGFLLATTLGLASAAADGVKVDESALRYYAAHNDADRLAAEVRRLKALYPDWQEPADPAGGPDGADDRMQTLWTLYAAGDRAALDKALGDMRAADPAFAPSDDFLAKKGRRDDRDRLIAASEAGEPAEAVRLAAARPDLAGCDDLDVSWRLAAAEAATGAADVALATYRQLLSDCTDAAGRLATVQKAVATLGAEKGHTLLALETTPGEFEALRPDFARAVIAASLSGASTVEPDPADLAALEKLAAAGPKPDDAAMLGWWYRARHRGETALDHFRAAATLAGPNLDAKIAEGLALTLADTGRAADAARVAHDNRDRSEALARLYVGLGASVFEGKPRPAVSGALLSDYAETVSRLSSAEGAEILGWYFLDLKDAAAANDWFGRGLAWRPSEKLAGGAVYAALAGKDAAAAKALLARWSPDYPALARIDLGRKESGKPAARDAILVAFEAGDFRSCAARAAGRGTLAPDLSLTEGWCLMRLDRPAEAALAFDRAMAGSSKVREDAAYGKSLASLASGDASGAVATAMAGVGKPERRAEIGAAALAASAEDRFAGKDYRGALAALDQRAATTAETQDLALLRGWCLWHLGDRREARELFARLDGLMSTRETRRALAAANGG